MDGFLFIDKKKGDSSFQVIRNLKGFLREKGVPIKGLKIGHAGTLDPIATGLLIVAVGDATRLLQYVLGQKKSYRCVLEFGSVSDTYDADGGIESLASAQPVSLAAIKKVIHDKFSGEFLQMPPRFSAKKVNGKRAYDLARAGEEFSLQPKKITIYDFKVISFEWPRFEFKVSCSSGTYIRSIVHDLGQALKVGAYMVELRRLSIGEILVEQCDENLLHGASKVLANFSSVELNEEEYKVLFDGKLLAHPLSKKVEQGMEVLAYVGGKVVGVLEVVKVAKVAFESSEKFLKFRKRLNHPF